MDRPLERAAHRCAEDGAPEQAEVGECALAGVTILDLTHHIAGPFCTRMLAALGAEVIKVERPGSGDPSRRAGPFPNDRPDRETSGLFLYLNMGKKSITLDLKSSSGRALFKELVKGCDVLVENFAPRVMPALGLSYETLREINPRLVMTSISNFGQTGPYRDFKAQDIVLTAMGGLSYTIGDPDREPLTPGGSQAQYIAGTCAATATMLALYASPVSSEGQHVDVSIFEAVAANLDTTDLYYTYFGGISGRGGYRYLVGYPIDVYAAADGLFVLNASGQGGNGLTMLPLLVDKPELVAHPFFNPVDPTARMEATYEEFDALLGDYFATHPRMEIIEKAQRLRMGFAPLQTMDQLLDDPQLTERGFFVELEHPRAGTWRHPGVAWSTSECHSRLTRAPLLGEHGEEILCGRLGLSREDLVTLRSTGCV